MSVLTVNTEVNSIVSQVLSSVYSNISSADSLNSISRKVTRVIEQGHYTSRESVFAKVKSGIDDYFCGSYTAFNAAARIFEQLGRSSEIDNKYL